METPIAAAISVAPRLIFRSVRAAKTRREKTSRPSSSVPSQNSLEEWANRSLDEVCRAVWSDHAGDERRDHEWQQEQEP